jgi:transposase
VSKRGHADLRKALYMPGMVAIRYNPLIKDMAERALLSPLASALEI